MLDLPPDRRFHGHAVLPGPDDRRSANRHLKVYDLAVRRRVSRHGTLGWARGDCDRRWIGQWLAIAEAFAREGAMVTIGEYSQERGKAAAERVREALYVQADVRRWRMSIGW